LAITKLGGVVTGIRGTVGGVVYSANKSGTFVKQWNRGANPRTVFQTTIRSDLSGMGRIWQGLTDAQRADWDTFAATDPEPTTNSLGDAVVLSGWGYFCRLNIRRAQYSLVALEDPPGAPEDAQPDSMAPLTLVVRVPGSGASTITWDTTNAVANGLGVIMMAFRVGAGTIQASSGYRLVGLVPAGDGTADSATVIGEKFGLVQAGWRCSCWFYQRRSGGLQSVVEAINTVVI
jgi:hypothetical protein